MQAIHTFSLTSHTEWKHVIAGSLIEDTYHNMHNQLVHVIQSTGHHDNKTLAVAFFFPRNFKSLIFFLNTVGDVLLTFTDTNNLDLETLSWAIRERSLFGTNVEHVSTATSSSVEILSDKKFYPLGVTFLTHENRFYWMFSLKSEKIWVQD